MSSPKIPKPPTAWRAPKEEFKKIADFHAFEEPPPPPPDKEFVAACAHADKWDTRIDNVGKRYADLLEFEQAEMRAVADIEKKLAGLGEQVRLLVFPPPPPPEIVVSGAKARASAAKKKAETPPPEPQPALSPEEERRKNKLLHLFMTRFNRRKISGGAAAAATGAAQAGCSAAERLASVTPPAAAGGVGGGRALSYTGSATEVGDGEGGEETVAGGGKPADVDDDTWRRLLALREERLALEAALEGARRRVDVARERTQLLQVMLDLSSYSSIAAATMRDKHAPAAGAGGGGGGGLGASTSVTISGSATGRSHGGAPLSGRGKSFSHGHHPVG